MGEVGDQVGSVIRFHEFNYFKIRESELLAGKGSPAGDSGSIEGGVVNYFGVRFIQQDLLFQILRDANKEVELGEAVNLTGHFDPSIQQLGLHFDQVQSKAFSFDVRMKSFIHFEHTLAVTRQVNSHPIVFYRKHKVAVVLAGSYFNQGSPFRRPVLKRVAD